MGKIRVAQLIWIVSVFDPCPLMGLKILQAGLTYVVQVFIALSSKGVYACVYRGGGYD